MNDPISKYSVEFVAKFLALIVPISFALSVLHDTGFYLFLGLSFNDLSLTWLDQFKFSLSWIPETIFFIAVGFLFAFLQHKMEQEIKGMEDKIKENDKAYTGDNLGKKVRLVGVVIILVSSTLGMLSWLMLGDTIFSRGNSVVSAWVLVIAVLMYAPLTKHRLNQLQWNLIAFVPAVAFFVFFKGFYSADFQKFDLVSIETKNELKKIEGYRLIRVYERGALVTNGTTIIFIANDQITQISRKQMQYKFIGVVGKWWP